MHRFYFPASLLLILLSGCGSSSRPVSLPIWQKHVEQYVHEQGKGDPTVLRDVTIADGKKGFALLGSPDRGDSTDAVGLLLGHRAIQGGPSFIYLVGLVERGKIADIRLVSVAFEHDKPTWATTPANPAALDVYRKYRTSQWQQHFPDRPTPPLASSNFPASDDVFRLSTDDDRVTAVHPSSGATWTLKVGR
jgi:hypothetical protein